MENHVNWLETITESELTVNAGLANAFISAIAIMESTRF